MNDLVEWLRAPVDDDERAAPRVHSEDCALHAWLRSDVPSACDCGWPARALREVEAKRKIVVRHTPRADMGDVDQSGNPLCPRCQTAFGRVRAPCSELLDIAAVYSDRPGYRGSDWAPR